MATPTPRRSSKMTMGKGLTVRERAELIDQTDWSKEFVFEELETFAQYVEVRHYRGGGVIFSEGAREAHMCVITRGQVSVIKRGPRNGEKVIARLGPGKTLGEMSLVDGQPRSASVVADSDTTLLMLRRSQFDELSSKVPRLALKVMMLTARMMSQKLRQTSGALIELLE